jgi:hypothetical protein
MYCQKYCSKQCYKRAKHVRHIKKCGYPKNLTKFCEKCEIEFHTRFKKQKYCSKDCSDKAMKKYLDIPDCIQGSSRKLDKNIGYVRLYAPMHPEANTWGYVYEHRIIAENIIGRRLKENEVVHHKNGIRYDNRPENLEVMDKIEHSRIKRSAKEELDFPSSDISRVTSPDDWQVNTV